MSIVPDLSAFSISGGQGYGILKLNNAAKASVASYISGGFKFNEYIEFKYQSVDTSLRMPVLPFRLIDIENNSFVNSDGNKSYISYDTDLFSLALSYPMFKYLILTGSYGIGKAKIYEVEVDSSDNYSMHLSKSLIHGVTFSVESFFKLKDKFLVYPSVGLLTHFITNAGSYKNAYYLHMSLSVIYLL